jgi:hypothetical protein
LINVEKELIKTKQTEVISNHTLSKNASLEMFCSVDGDVANSLTLFMYRVIQEER